MANPKTCRHNIVTQKVTRCRCIENHNRKPTHWECASCDQVLSKSSNLLKDKNYVYNEDFDIWVHVPKK